MSDEFGTTYGFDIYLKLWQCWHMMPAMANSFSSPFVALAKQVNRLYSRYLFPRRNRARHVNQHITKLLDSTAEPFFLYAIYWDTHLPYYPHGEHAGRWLPQSATASRVRQVNRNALPYFTGQTAMTEEDFAILVGDYDGALATIDAAIGALLQTLRQRHLLDNTLVLITSDHGENIGDHGLMSHAYSLHDTLIRVPLLIRYPGGAHGGTRVTQQVQLPDLFPTILDCLELERPDVRQEFQGVSLLETPTHAAERLAYAEMLAPHPSIQALNRRTGLPADTTWPQYDRALRCLRTPEAKLIWASDGQHALYDLRQDPGETTNRFTAEPERAQALMEALMAWQPPTGVPLYAPTPELDPDVRQRLRALGYVD
jgi:arylsulfatase A-like enzyme